MSNGLTQLWAALRSIVQGDANRSVCLQRMSRTVCIEDVPRFSSIVSLNLGWDEEFWLVPETGVEFEQEPLSLRGGHLLINAQGRPATRIEVETAGLSFQRVSIRRRQPPAQSTRSPTAEDANEQN